ncbi:hypothetical protein [Pseudomonas luteola]|uniref:hypothetical protein n=1 Tax=Pseudomonas luteola TaxID=47886 RepID=UPI00123A8FAB|nr:MULTISPECIES: hypothetical protein [Pseudomonas]MBA1249900.1 hypothetical protein [Pseudomonas zeshuii]QEU28802.1 hypothetical protein FOB45_13850 [Pseudomonas luteola]QEU28869.1 hypothetical protein FOB45_14225 [Pseudomonas luteola]
MSEIPRYMVIGSKGMVMASDHDKRVAELEAKIERLKAQLDIAQTFIEQLTKVVTVNGSSLSQRASEILIAMQDQP